MLCMYEYVTYIGLAMNMYMYTMITCIHTCQSWPINHTNKRREEKRFPCLPALLNLLDQIDYTHIDTLFSLSFSLFAHLSFTTHNQKKKKNKNKSRSKVVVKLSFHQSINQSIDQSSIRVFIKEKRNQIQRNVILFFCFDIDSAGPPPSLRAALLCPLHHLRHCPCGIF